MTEIHALPQESEFHFPDSGIYGKLVYVNACRAYVYIPAQPNLEYYGLHQGYDNWSPNTIVASGPFTGQQAPLARPASPLAAPTKPDNPIAGMVAPPKAGARRRANSGGPSAREIVFEMLQENPDITAKDIYKELEGALQFKTIRMYLYKFRNMKEMPSYAQ